jgi:thymidine kinase
MSKNELLQGWVPENQGEEISEIYSILQKDHGDILYVDDFDVPKEKLDFYTSRHYELYSEKAEKIYKDLPESLVLSSGMFGGKTTLSFLLMERLLEEGRSVDMLIADVMGEDYITARSYKDCQRRMAIRFGNLTDYERTLDILAKSNTDVIFLDEFSFLEVKIVEDLQMMCLSEGKNLILTGLNSSYLGQPLPAFSEGSSIIKKSEVEECFSFVTGFCEDEPMGTSTIRYVRIDNRWVLDFGLLPLVVSKEKTNIVHYAPAIHEHTAVYILQNHQKILNSILNPSEEKVVRQNSLLQILEANLLPSL